MSGKRGPPFFCATQLGLLPHKSRSEFGFAKGSTRAVFPPRQPSKPGESPRGNMPRCGGFFLSGVGFARVRPCPSAGLLFRRRLTTGSKEHLAMGELFRTRARPRPSIVCRVRRLAFDHKPCSKGGSREGKHSLSHRIRLVVHRGRSHPGSGNSAHRMADRSAPATGEGVNQALKFPIPNSEFPMQHSVLELNCEYPVLRRGHSFRGRSS